MQRELELKVELSKSDVERLGGELLVGDLSVGLRKPRSCELSTSIRLSMVASCLSAISRWVLRKPRSCELSTSIRLSMICMPPVSLSG